MKNEGDNSSGVASVILGIISISCILFTFFALLAPLVGLALSIISLLFARAQYKSGKNKWSKAGTILSIIGIILNVIVIFFFISAVSGLITQYKALCDAAGGCENIQSYLQSQGVAAG